MFDVRSKLVRFLDFSKPKTVLHLAIWIAACAVGGISVAFARVVSAVQDYYFEAFAAYPISVSLISPVFFIVATWVVVRFAPQAKGSGIPQVLVAVEHAKVHSKDPNQWIEPFVSMKTALIKIISSIIGLLGGASIGREGPTVQISAALSVWIGRFCCRFVPQLDLRTFVVAGSAAGVAAAFNTPIAGIAFAIEELAVGAISSFKHNVMLAIIISGIVAQGLSGDYLYFGHPIVLKTAVWVLLGQSLIIGFCGGVLGGFFSWALSRTWAARYGWLKRSLVAGLVCSLVNWCVKGDTAGSGYEVTKNLLESPNLQQYSLGFPVLKLFATVTSYFSGMAGGIFSPSLSIGAGVGFFVAKVFGFINFKACALFGMIAFFSGAIQAPLTAVIIVMEMTDEHILAIPFMIAAFVATSLGKRFMHDSLYYYLSCKEIQ